MWPIKKERGMGVPPSEETGQARPDREGEKLK